jgi:hypothetical protein
MMLAYCFTTALLLYYSFTEFGMSHTGAPERLLLTTDLLLYYCYSTNLLLLYSFAMSQTGGSE